MFFSYFNYDATIKFKLSFIDVFSSGTIRAVVVFHFVSLKGKSRRRNKIDQSLKAPDKREMQLAWHQCFAGCI